MSWFETTHFETSLTLLNFAKLNINWICQLFFISYLIQLRVVTQFLYVFLIIKLIDFCYNSRLTNDLNKILFDLK